MPPLDADVIIVGAGPAGSLAAFELASKGIRVLILEKSFFPRYKTCGGGLTHKILREIPFDITSVIESTIYSIRFSRHFNKVYTRTSKDPIMYCIMRSELDAFLLDKAIHAGARIQMNQHVLGIKEISGEIVVTVKDSEFRSKLLIGAEGASGIVARSFNLREHVVPGLAWEAEIKIASDFLTLFSDTVFLDWGTFPGGYGWAFPKKDHFSLGVGGPARLSKMMMQYYQKFLDYFLSSTKTGKKSDSKIISKLPDHQILSLKSWPIPVKTSKGIFHHSHIMVAGDAAGLTDPLTGEGVYYAVRSGKIAAETCFNYFNGNTDSLNTYSERVNEELMPELLEANKIKNLFNAFSSRIHFFVRDNDLAWRAFAKILRGERWYADVRKGFGNLKYLWNLVCVISMWLGKAKEIRFSVYIKKTHHGKGGS